MISAVYGSQQPDSQFFSAVDIICFSVVALFAVVFLVRVFLIFARHGRKGLRDKVGRPLVDSATVEYKIYGLPVKTDQDLIDRINEDGDGQSQDRDNRLRPAKNLDQ